MPTNGRRDFKTFPLLIIALCCLCRRPGGLTIFVPGTRRKIDRPGMRRGIEYIPQYSRGNTRMTRIDYGHDFKRDVAAFLRQSS